MVILGILNPAGAGTVIALHNNDLIDDETYNRFINFFMNDEEERGKIITEFPQNFASAMNKNAEQTSQLVNNLVDLDKGFDDVKDSIKATATFVTIVYGLSKIKSFKKSAEATKGTVKAIPTWKGSGPVSGVLGVNANSKSVAAIKNYYPKDGGIEFVFDPKTNTFVVGKPPKGIFEGSAHQQLARSIGSDESTVLGGTFSRGSKGEIFTTEHSGHYGKHWTEQLRQQFQNVMKEYGLPVIHENWGQ